MGKVGVVLIYWRGILMSFMMATKNGFTVEYYILIIDANITQLITQQKPYSK